MTGYRSLLRAAVAGSLFLGLALFSSKSHAEADESARLQNQRHLFEVGLFLGIDFLASKHDLFDATLAHSTYNKVAPEIGLRAAYLPLPYFGLEVEASLVPTKAAGDNALIYAVRGHLLAQYPVWKGLTPFVLAGAGMLGVSSSDAVLGKDMDWALHWGVGLKCYFNHWVAARLEFRHVVSDGLDDAPAHHFAALAGVSLVLGWKRPSRPDRDKDGVPDDVDQCPDQPGPAPHGCPDKDGDGIPDARDECPDEPGKHPHGCPDRDGDGIIDSKDECPDEPGKAPHGCPDRDGDGIPDAKDECPDDPGKPPHGCPDRDGDGIPDAKDECPDEPGPAPHGCPDKDGDGIPDRRDECPDDPGKAPHGCPDTDGDGIIDPKDQCPTKAGPAPHGCPDSDGDGLFDHEDRCPTIPAKTKDGCPEEIRRYTGAIKGIFFAYNSAKIERRSHRVLNQARNVLRKYPDLKIMITGHTDDEGPRERNMKLSAARADSVKAYLVGQGIAEERVQTAGKGPDEPLDPGKSRAARARNRRIEFSIINK